MTSIEPQRSWPGPSSEVPPGSQPILLNTAYRSVADVGAKLASMALYLVMARRVGDAQFGVYTLALTIVTLVTTVGDLGQESILTREVARDRRQIHGYYANTVAMRLVLSLTALSVAVALSGAVGLEGETRLLVLLLGLGLTAELVTSTCFAVFQAYERLSLIPVVLLSQRWLTATVGIVALLLGAGVVAVAGAYLLGATLALLLAINLVSRKVVKTELQIDVRRWWPLARAALPVGLVGISVTVLFRVDTAVLGAFASVAEVGHYGAAYRLLEGTTFIGWSVAAAVFPVFSRLQPAGVAALRPLLERALKLVLALALPLSVGSATLASPLILLLYGLEFRPAAEGLLLLSPNMTLFPLATIGGYLLVAQNRQMQLAMIYGVTAAVHVALAFSLIPSLALQGAALSGLASQLVLVAVTAWATVTMVGTLAWGRVAFGPVVAALLAGVAMLALRDALMVAIAAGATVYLATLVAIERTFFPEDLRAVTSRFGKRS